MTAQDEVQGVDRPIANAVIRGKVISDNLVEIGGRGGDLIFRTPDAHTLIGRLPLGAGGRLADLYGLTFEDILDYLQALGERLDVGTNERLRLARELSYRTAPTTPPIVDASYARLGHFFKREVVREMAQTQLGIDYLEGWVEQERLNGLKLAVRCFGARTVHVVAGNAPHISALTIVRNAILRSDAIIKAPSNDPFTAVAIAETMVEMDPDHPLTKHLSVAYWRGGDACLEEQLYQPENVEKIIAWGGFASIKHVTRYIQPGLELISLDPKRSASVVGAEALADEAIMAEAAQRIASDVGAMNQVGCVNARVVYVMCGTDEDGIAKLNRLGKQVYDALLKLPESVSTKPRRYDRELKSHVDALRLDDEWFVVIGGEQGEGAVIVSQIPEAVEFATRLVDRTVNLVPVGGIDEVVGQVNAYTQTVGIFPEALKAELIDVMALHGAQRFVSLGYAVSGSTAAPQDGIEPVRRMGKWIINEISTPETVVPPWKWGPPAQ